MKIEIDIVTHPRAAMPAEITAEVSEAGITATLLVSNKLRTGPILRRLATAIDQVVENVNQEAAPLGTIQQGTLFQPEGDQR